MRARAGRLTDGREDGSQQPRARRLLLRGQGRVVRAVRVDERKRRLHARRLVACAAAHDVLGVGAQQDRVPGGRRVWFLLAASAV